MSHNTNTPTREMVIIDAITGTAMLEFDPFYVAVSDGLADAFDDTVVTACRAAGTYAEMYPAAEVTLVWSDDDKPVRAVCPICDDLFSVGDGLPIILDGESIMCCGDRECAEMNG